ncbi:CinA family protein [Alcanivorax quisquiliarum]|uniref:Nicotinamide-nucleotide amidohydrolase family protein n=1 Tax=Alcanivorax quisquiliarum TaxID=2933565 RepID=A0ABT0E6T4_9GAMM|nr:nicotinamide-nucleotide amidohydrolase family protein [Alcanivorax quisquiliarum]MCK0537534.1 nicotinamide-nucleotide amidohydrolase family protein [Alcanivorax quisquiliarum]
MRHQQLATEVGEALARAEISLATAESCTGGAIAAAITDIAGCSGWFERGFVTYSNESKMAMLGVPQELLAQHGAVSEPVARAMAEGALQHSLADISVAVTGIAGPDGGSAEKPVGTVWFAWARRDGGTDTHCQCLAGDRDGVRSGAIEVALRGLLARLPGARS